ncbi:MAG: bifunctional 5,10-methylenetetrahydrofolate dehydrogenase/5,10-methenyltetrahydrofolate cyclohydrolase [Verrucomicrobia bacterium]|nr:bifunctional 5,10-methylenetetrahydrofolate dehydrogenase/5,10-methenyltetrahydrofolate cyclohydrolase [Verrucomicrobiota bacterium]
MIIDGKQIAQQLKEELREQVAELARQHGRKPCLDVILVGENPASMSYVRSKIKATEYCGFEGELIQLPTSTTQAELLKIIHERNNNDAVDGLLVQLPLPAHIDEQQVIEAISPEKDVDGFHPVNVGKLLLGDTNGFVPCTPGGIHELLIRSGVETSGANVVILGRGNIVGKPMASILMQKGPHANATVTICHSRSRNIESICRNADILIAALGVAEFVKADMVKPGAAVIDVGVNRSNDANVPKGYRLVGDVDFNAVQPIAGKITPNPGGVGPMTIAMLMKNTVRAAKMANLKQ